MKVKPFREGSFFCFIVDYINAKGEYYFQSFKAERAPGRTARDAACGVCDNLREQGYKPYALRWIKGSYSLQQLFRMADTGEGFDPKKCVGWIVDEVIFREAAWDEIRSGRLNIFDCL